MTVLHQQECFEEGQLLDVLKGDRSSALIEEHLSQCDICRNKLDSITDSQYLRSFSEQQRTPYTFLEPPLRPTDLGSIDGIAIEHVVSQGGMGVVFSGHEIKLDRRVAVKVLLNQHGEDEYQRFETEVKALAKLSHGSIVGIHSVGQTLDFRPYMVMEYVEGVSLHQLIADSLPTPKCVARYIEQIARALHAAHEAGMIHRDVKPANILIDEHEDTAKLIDFGLARDSSLPSITRVNVLCGTPEYMAPEQTSTSLSSQRDGRVDVYGLGIVLYECLTGTVPFRGQPLDVLEQHRNSEPLAPGDLNRSLPRDLETICLKAISKELHQRYRNAQAFADDLARFLEGRPIEARPISWLRKLSLWIKRNPQLSLALGLFLATVVIGSGTIAYLWQRSRTNEFVALSLAEKLEQSRQRMRQSVDQFQRRVFSKEALHWQMSSEFRSEMFRDVIQFLDEFNSLPAASSSQEQESLASSYLDVAQAAIEVGQYNEAQLASQRSLKILESTPSESRTARTHLNYSRSARIELRSGQALGTATLDEQLALLKSARSSATKLMSLDPSNLEFESNYLLGEMDFCLLGLGSYAEPSFRRQIATDVRDRSSTFRKNLDNRPHTSAMTHAEITSQWILAACAPAEECAVYFDEADKGIARLREQLRGLGSTLLESDLLSARNQLLRAKWHWRQGRESEAIAALLAAEGSYLEVVNRQPQNRIARVELAQTQRLGSQYYSQQSIADLATARQWINKVILNMVHILENDAKDMSLRMTIIGDLLTYGDLSEQLSDPKGAFRGYNTAQTDCKLIVGNPELVAWARDTRVHAIRLTYHALKAQDPSKAKELATYVIQVESKRFPILATLTEEVFEEAYNPRPSPPIADRPVFPMLRFATTNW
jgi:serine/threonine protein kinase